MYNHDLKSIFVHIPKTAGWTLHKTLENNYGFHSAGHCVNFRRKCWGRTNSNPWVSVRHYPSKMLKDEYLNDYFKFEGKAYCEDLYHSILTPKKICNLIDQIIFRHN